MSVFDGADRLVQEAKDRLAAKNERITLLETQVAALREALNRTLLYMAPSDPLHREIQAALASPAAKEKQG